VKHNLVGLDIGTSCVKAAVFDERGNALFVASAPLQVFTPFAGWAEQDPEEYWTATCSVLKEVFNKIDPRSVSGIGLSGQCPSHVLVDANYRALGKAIIWRDQRAQDEAKWMNQQVAPAQAVEWLGSSNLGDATSPPARLLWLKENQSSDWTKAVTVLQPKDFVALRFTDKVATDCYSAYCLANPDSGIYDPAYFKTLGLPIEKMPRTLFPSEVAGEVTEKAALATGLKPGTQVIIGTIDAYCDNLAGGAIFPGRAVDIAGTSEIVSLGIEKLVVAEGVYPARIGNDGMFLCGPTQAGGETLKWLAHSFYQEFHKGIQYDAMEREAKGSPPGANCLLFLPYLNGERAPIWDAKAVGAFVGLTFSHDRRHFTRAVYEGVAFAIRHILEISETAAGVSSREVVIGGGGSRSDFWNQIKANVLQKIVKPTMVSETGCLGAAILASVGMGYQKSVKDACLAMIQLKPGIQPDSKLSGMYNTMYSHYRDFYPALKMVCSGEGS
jgi:xylulokinase